MKKYIRLNNNDKHLSWGNFTRIIKENTINKLGALQVEIFNVIFDNYNINDTTVNNYCIGIRGINDCYKQKYIIYQKKYMQNEDILLDTILNLLSIITGNLYSNMNKEEKLNTINNNTILRIIVIKLYHISKNDKEVDEELSISILNFIENNDLYNALVQVLFFIILNKKQPQYEEDVKKEIIDNLLTNTLVSPSELEEYLKLKFSEGINYNYSLNILGKENNTYALYELGTNEYKGYIKGYPRYDASYEYFKRASSKNYPSSFYMMARMLIDGNVGTKRKDDYKIAFEYLNKAIGLGNIASINLLGNMYREGLYVKKDLDKAILLYKEASSYNYVYAYNNLGKIYEDKKDYQKAFSYFEKSAVLGEAYSLNKLGEYYRKGIYVEKDLNKAFELYNKATIVPIDNIYPYAYYNLAKYFYLTGDVVLVKDKKTAYEYLDIAGKYGVLEASILLLQLYVEDYLSIREDSILDEIKRLTNAIESSSEYSDKLRKEIEDSLFKIKENKKINIDMIF